MLRADDPYSLATLFHRNSEPWGNQDAYDDPHARVMEFKQIDGDAAIDLPAVQGTALTSLIEERHSCRNYAAQPIALEELAALLIAAYGTTTLREWPGGQRALGRAVPSGGARYPLELYVVCNHVAGIARGIHHYNARLHTLEPVRVPCTLEELVPDLMHQDYLANAAALIVMTAVFSRMLDKYGARGYRYTLIECGHVAQNICLRALELGLQTLCIGGFTDHSLNAQLNLAQPKEGALYAVAVGHRALRTRGAPDERSDETA